MTEPGQDADGDGNIQIGGDGVVVKDSSDSIVAGRDMIISDVEFEKAYNDVREFLENQPFHLSQFGLRLSDQYLGDEAPDVHYKSKPVWFNYEESARILRENEPRFKGEPGVSYSLRQSEPPPDDWERVPIDVEQRVRSWTECNGSWEGSKRVVKILEGRSSSPLFSDAGLFTLVPAAKTLELHWRRVFLHPDDFETRHFSLTRALVKIGKGELSDIGDKTLCYESLYAPNPVICPSGPVWEHFKSALGEENGGVALKEMIKLTKRIWHQCAEYRHTNISDWSETKPVYEKITTYLEDFLSLLSGILEPNWA